MISDKKRYLLDTDIYGTQEEVKNYLLFHELYKELYDIDFKNTFFALNLNLTVPKKILNHPHKKIVISYHSEHIHYKELYDIAVDNKDRKFLIISDFSSAIIEDNEVNSHFWPDNVTMIKWLSWGVQIENAKNIFGIAKEPRIPTKKMSSLAHRHEFHKAAITAFILKKFNREEIIVSWHKWLLGDKIYYLEDDYEIHDEIKKYLFDPEFKKIEKITIDNFNESVNFEIQNTDWRHPAFLDCAVNVTNESTFQSIGNLHNDEMVFIPGPFITEKTIKPLLSGTAFIHVGQPFLLDELKKLGINTNFGFPDDYDNEPFEDERILKIYKTIEIVMNTSLEKLYDDSYKAIVNNLNCIESGDFYNNCKNRNKQNINKIYEWSLINP